VGTGGTAAWARLVVAARQDGRGAPVAGVSL